jgi:hypothetical protein
MLQKIRFFDKKDPKLSLSRHHHKFIKYEKRLRKEGKKMLGLPIKQNLCHFSASLDAIGIKIDTNRFGLAQVSA